MLTRPRKISGLLWPKDPDKMLHIVCRILGKPNTIQFFPLMKDTLGQDITIFLTDPNVTMITFLSFSGSPHIYTTIYSPLFEIPDIPQNTGRYRRVVVEKSQIRTTNRRSDSTVFSFISESGGILASCLIPDTTPTQEELYAKFSKFIDQFSERDEAILNQESFRGLSNTITLRINQLQAFISLASTLQTTNSQTYSESQKKAVLSQTLLQEYRIKHPVLRRLYSLVKAFKAHPSSSFPRTLSEIHALVRIMTSAVHITTTLLVCATLYQFFSIVVHKASQYLCDTFTQLLTLQYFPIVNLTALRQTLNSIKTLYTRTLSILTGIEDITPPYLNRAVQPLTEFLRKLNVITQLHKLSGCMLQLTNLFSSPSLHIYGGFFTIVKSRFSQLMMSLTRTTTEKQSFRFSSIFTALTQQKIEKTSQIVSRIVIDVATLLPDIIRSNLPLYMIQSAFIIYLHFLQLFPQAQRTVLNQLNKDDFSRLLTTAIFRKHVDFILIQTGCTKDQAMFSKTILPLMSTRMILVRNIGMFILYQIFSENEVKESRLNSKIQHNFEGLSQLIAEGEEIRRNIEGKLEEQMKFFVAKLNKFSATLVDTPCFIQSEGEGIESTEVTLHNMPEFSAELRFSTSVHQTAFIPTMSSVHSHISITETHHVLSWVLQIMKNTLNTLPSDTLQITQAWVKKCQDVVHYGSQNVTWTSEFLPSYCEELLQTYSQLEHTLSVFDSTHNKFLSGMESSISRLHFSFPVEPYTIVQLKNTIRPFSAEFNGVFEQLKKTYSDQAKALLGTLTRDSTFGEQNESKQKLFHFLITRMENVFDGEKIRVFSDVLESILARIVEGPLISIPLFLDDGDLSYSASPLSLFSNPFSFNQQGTQIPHHIILSHQLGDPKTENARESVENLAIISIFDGFIHLFEPKHLTEVIQSKIQNLSMQTLETEKLCRHYYADISRYAPFWSISAQDLFSSFNTSSIGRGGQQSDSGTFIKRLSAKRLVDHLRKISQNTGKDNNSSPLIAGQAPAVFEIDDLVGTFSITEDESEELTIPEIEPSLLLSLENSRLFDPLDLRHQLVADLSEELLHDFDFPETTTMRNLLSFSLKGTDSDTYNPPLKLWKDYIDFIRYFIQSVNNLPPPPETPLGKIDITQLKEALVKLSQQWLHPFTSFVFFGLIVRMRLIMIYLTNITSIVRAHSTKEDNAESVAQFVHLRNSFSFIFSVNETFKLMKQRIDILATLNPSQATILMTEFDRTKKIRQKFDEQDWYAAFDSVHLTERNIAKHLFDVSERLDEQLNSLIITFNNKELAPITLEVTAPKAKQMLAAIRIPVDEVADFIALSQASDQEPNPYIIERFNDLKQMKENLLSLWNLWERFETHVSSLKDMKWGELHSKITNDLKDEWKFLLDVYMDQVHALRPALQSKPVFKSIFQFVSQHHRIWAMIYTLATTPIYDWHWAAVMRAITPQFAVNDDVNAMKMGTMPIRHLFELCNECKDIEQLNSTIKSIQKDDEHYQKLQNLESTWAEAQIPLILTQAEKDSLVLAPTRTSDSKSRRHDKKRRVLLPFPVVNISQCSELAAATMQDLQEINKLNTNEIHPETVKKLKHLEDLLYSIQSFLLTLHDSHTLNEKLTTALTVNVLSTTQAMKKTITSFTHVGDALRKLSSFLDSELSNVDTQLSKVNVQASQLLNERTHDHLAFVSKSIPHLLLLSYSQLVDYIRLFDSPSVHLPSSLLTKMIAHVESVTFTQQEVSPSTSMVGKGNDTHQHNDKDAIITPVMITSTSGEALVFLGESGIKKTEFFRLHLHLVTKISDTLRNEMNVLQQTFMSKANVFSWFLQIVPQFTNQSSFPINPQILFICLDSFLNTQLNLIINPSTPHTDWSVFEHVGSLQGFIIFSTSYLIALLRCPAPLTTYSQFTVSLIVMFLDLYDNLKQLLDHHTVLLRNPMAQNHHSSSVTSFASLFDQITQTVLAFPQTPVEQQVDTSVNHQLFRDILSSLLSLLSIYAHRVAFHVQLISSTYQAVSLIPGNPYIQQKLVPQHYYLSVGKRLSNPIYTIFNLSTYLPWIPYSRDVFFLPFSEQVRLNEMTQVASIPQPHQTLSQAGPLFVVNRTETDYIYSHIHSFAHTYNKNLHVLHLAPNTSPLEIKRAIVYTLASSLWLLLDGIEVLPPATQQTMVDWCLSVRSWFQTIPTNQSGIVTMTLENVSVSVSLPADPWCVFGIYRTVENFHGKINDWVENCFTVISLSKIVRNGLIGSLLQSNGFIFFDELDTKIQTYFKSLSDRLPNHFDIKDTDIYDYFTSLSHLRQFTKKCGQRLHEVLLNAPYVLSQASLPLIQLNSLFASSFLAIHTLKSSTQETETLRLLEEMAVKQVMLDEIVSLDSSLELLAMYSYKATILPRMKVEQTQADLSFESSLERIVHSLFSHPSTLTTLPVFVNSTDQSSVALQQSDVVRVHSMSTSIHHDPPVLPSSRPFHSFLLKSFEETYDTPIVHINGKHGIGKTNLIALHQTLYCKLHGFPPFIIPVNAPRTVPTDSRLMFLEKDSETNLFRRIQKTFSRLGVINETGRQDSVSDMDIPVWIVISVISTPKLRFGAFLEECFQCTAHISYGRIEISFTNGQSFLLPRHSKIFIETRSSFLNYRGLLLQEPKLLSVYHPIYPLIQWKLDRWARNARTLIDSDVLDVGLVILRVALTKTSLLTELTEFGSTHSAEYVISSTGLIDSTTVLLTSLIRIDQKRYKRPIDGSLLRTYIVYAICWTIVGHVPSTAPLMSDYLDWLDDWRMKVPSVNDTPLDHIRQEMNKKHNLLSLQGASTIVPKKNFNHIQQFEDFIKKTFLSASERFETSIWHYAPDPVEKILLPLEKIPPEHCLFTFDFQSHANIIDHQHHLYYLSYVTPFLALLLEGRDVILIDNFPTPTRNFAFCVLEAMSYQTVPHKSNRHLFTQDQYMFFSRFSWQHVPFSSINKTVSLPNGTVQLTSKSDVQDHLQVNSLINDLSREDHSDPKSVVKPPKDVIRLYEQQVPRRPSVWVVDEIDLATIPELINAVNHSTVISALQFTNHRLAHIAECFWKDGVYVRSHPIPIEADDAGNQPEVEPLFAENDQVGSIYFTSMVPATMYVHNVMVNTTTKIKRTSLAHYYRVLEAISFAGEDITNDLPQFCWFWTWEMERVFVNEQVTETQRQFVQSLIRDAFGNFFPRRFTVTSNSHPSHDPIVTSTFLSRMASSKWPVNSIVPYDACVYPFTFESYSESSHGRARSMVNDRQCPLVSVFDHAFHANPDTSQFTSQEKHTMDTLLLSHTSSIQFLGLIETLQDSCEPIVITDAAGANALLWMKLAAVLVRKPMDFVDCPSNPSSFLVFLDSIALFFSTRQRLLPNLSHSSLGGSARRQPSKTIFTQLSIADTSPSNVDSFFVVSLSNPNTSDLALELLDVLFKTHEFPPSLRNCTITPLQDNSSEPIPTTLSEALLYLFRRIAYKKQQTFPTDSVYLIDSIGNIAVKSRCVIHLNNINTKKVTHRLSHFLFDAPSFVVLNLGWSSLVEIAANYFHPMVKANMWYFALLNKTAQSKLFKEDRNIAITENRNQNSTMAYPNVSPMQSPIRTMIPPDKDVLFVFLHLIVEIFHEASNQKLLNSTDTTIWHIQENNDVVNNIQIPSFSDADFVDFLDCIKQLVSIGLQAYTGTSGKIDSVLIAFETLKMRTELNQQILSDTELFSASQQITGAIDGSLKAIILSIERKQASIIRLEQQLELVKDDYYIDEKGPLHPAHQCSESFLKSMDHLDSITPNAIKSIREAAGFHMTINLLLSCVALLVTVPSVSSFDKSTTNEEILDLMWNVSIVRLSNKIATEVLILFQNEINLDALPSTLPECRRLALWVQEITMLVITASQLDDNDYMQFALHHSNAQTRVTLKRMKVELNSLLNVKSSIEAFTLSNTIQSTPSILRTAKTLLLRAENVILGADQFITELKQESENIKQDTMTLLGDALMSATFYSLGNRFWAPDDSVLDQTTRSLIQDSIIPVSQHVVPLLFPQKLMMFLDMGIETPFNPFVEGEQQPLQIPTPTTAINLNPALNRSGLYPILIPDYQLSWSSPLFIRLADSSRDDTENNFFSESSKKTQQIGVYPQVQNERDPLSKQTYLMYTGSQGFMVDLASRFFFARGWYYRSMQDRLVKQRTDTRNSFSSFFDAFSHTVKYPLVFDPFGVVTITPSKTLSTTGEGNLYSFLGINDPRTSSNVISLKSQTAYADLISLIQTIQLQKEDQPTSREVKQEFSVIVLTHVSDLTIDERISYLLRQIRKVQAQSLFKQPLSVHPITLMDGLIHKASHFPYASRASLLSESSSESVTIMSPNATKITPYSINPYNHISPSFQSPITIPPDLFICLVADSSNTATFFDPWSSYTYPIVIPPTEKTFRLFLKPQVSQSLDAIGKSVSTQQSQFKTSFVPDYHTLFRITQENMRRRSQLLTNMIHISDTRLFPHQIPLLATTLYSLFNTKNEKEETCSSADLVSQPGYQSSVFSLNNQVSLTRLRQSSRIISLDKTEPQLLSQFSARAIRDDDAVAAIKRNMELLEMKGDQFIIKEDIGSKDHIDMQDDSDGSMNNFSDSGNLGSPGMQTMSDSESIDLLFSPVPGDDEKRDVRHSQDLNLSLPLKPSISSGTESNSPLELDQTKKSSPTSLIKGQTISHLSSISPDSQLGSASQTMKLFSQPDSTSQSLPRKKSPGIQEEMTKALSARSFHTRPESPVVQSSSLFKPATSLQSSPTLFLAPPNVQIPIRPKQLSPPPTSLSLVINDSSVDDGYENSIAHKSSSPTMHIPLVPMSPYSDSEASVYSDDFKQPVVPKIQIKETTTVEPIHQTPSSPLILGDDPPEPLKGGKPTSSLSLTIQNPDLELSHRTPGALSGSFQFEGYSDDSDASVYDDSAPSPPPPLKDVSTSKFAPTALPKPHGKAVPSLLFSGSDQIQTQSSGEELHEPPLLVDADDDSSLSSLPLRGEGSSHIAKLHKPEGKLLQSRFPQLESNYSITKASTEVFSGQLDGSSQSLIDKQRIENEQITMNLSIALFLVGIGEWDVIDQAASDSIGRQLTQDVTHFNKSRLQQKEQLEMFQFSLMWEYHHVTPLVNDMCRFAFGIERMISKPFCVITPQITVQESFHRLLYVILKDIQQSLKEELGKTASQQTQFQANQEIGLDGTPVSELGAERQSGTMTTLFHLLQQSESDVSPIGLSPYARERLVKQIVSLFISNIQAEIQSMKFYQALLFYFTLCNFTKEKSSFLSKVELSVLLYHRSMFIHKPSAMERNRHSSSTQVTPIDFADNFLEKTKLFMPLEAWALETHHLIPRNPVPMWMPNYVWKNLFCLAAVCPSFRPMVEDLDESTTQTFHMIDKLPQAPIQTKTPFNLFDPYFEQILKQELDAETVVWDQTETQDTIWLDMMDEDGKKQIHSMAGSSSAKQGSTTISSHFVTPIQALWGEWFISMDPACSPTPNKKINALNQHQRAILIAAIRPSQIGKALTQALLSDYDLEPDHALFMGSLPSISLHSDQTMNSESESIVSSRHFYCGQAWIEDLFKRNVYMTGTEIDRCPFRIILLSAGSYPYQSCHNSINIITDLRSIAKKRSVPFLHLSIISKFRNYCPTSFDTNASPSEIDQAWLSTWFAFKEDVENVLSRGGWIVIPDIRFTAPIFLREIGRWMNRCGNGDTPFMSQKTNGTSTVRLSDKRGDAGNDITPPAIWIINAECDTLSNMDLVTNIVFATASTIDKRKIRPPCTFRGFAIYGLTLAIQIFPQKSILDMVKALNSKEQINGPLYCSICHLLFLFVMFNALLVEYSRNRSNTQDWFTFSTRTLTFGFSRLQAMIQSSQKSNRNSQSDNPLRLYDFVNVSQLIYVIETEIYTSLPASLPMAVFRKLEATMFSPDRFIVNDGPPVYRGISNPEDSTHLNGLGQYMQTILHHRSVDNIDETTQHIHRMKSNSFSQLSIVEQFLISFAGTLDPLSPLVVTTNNYHDTSYRTWDVCSDYQIIDTVQHFVVDVNAIPPHFLATIPRIVQSFESNPNIVESTLKEIQNLLQGALFDVDSILKTVHHPTFWQGHPDTDMHMVNESLMFNFSASTLYGALQTVLDHHKMTKLPTDTLSLSLLHGTHFPSNDLSLEPFIAHTGLIIPTREGLFAPAPYFSAKHHTGLSSLGRVRDKALMQYSLGFSDPPTFFSRFFRLNEKRSSSMTKPPGSDYSLKAENLGIGVERFLSRFLQINDYFSSIPLPSRIKNLNQIDASSTIFSLLNTNRTEPLQICRPINPGVLFNTPNIFLSLRIDELTRNRRDLSFSESSPPTDQQGSKSTVITLDSLSMELHPTNLRSLSDVTAASADQQLQSPPISSLATPSTQRLFVLGGLNLRSSIPTIFELHNIHLRLTSHQQPTFIFIKSNRSNILSLFTLPNTALLFPSFEFPTSADILPSDLSGTAVPTYGLPFLSTGFTSLRRHGDAKHANLQVQTCTEKGINDVYYVLANSDLNSALLFSHSTMVKFS